MLRDGRLAARLGLGLLTLSMLGCIGISFSPDGTKLAFPWGNKSELGISVYDLGTHQVKVLPSSKDSILPIWSPRGDHILWFGGQQSETLYIANPTTGKQREVAKAAVGAVWSTNGEKLAFLERLENRAESVVWYEVDSGRRAGSIQIPKDVTPDVLLSWPVWLPATQGVAFVGGSNTGSDVYIAEFGEVRKVTTTGDVVGFGISQDRAYLQWARKSRNPRYILLSLYRYNLNLRSVERLPFPERISEINPNPKTGPKELESVFFSPDLKRLILLLKSEGSKANAIKVTTRSGKGSRPTLITFPEDIHVMMAIGVDGIGPRQIAKWRDAGSGSKEFYWPTFSPDSKQIALLHSGAKTNDVLLMNADGSNRRVILSQKAAK